jgi:short-subunit dehydrogenase
MNIHGARVLLSGATGGIGRPLAELLAAKGARLALVGRDRERLAWLAARLHADAMVFDLTSTGGHAELMANALQQLGGLDLLINAAGVSEFGCFEDDTPASIHRLIAVNLVAPMALTAVALPHLAAGARIVNVGSVFGAIGFPYFTTYSASKFGLRGFSEALRRELADRGIGVTYVAPRATRTPMNNAAVHRYAERTGMVFDDPAIVAMHIVQAIEKEASERTFGLAESAFARLAGMLPRLFDRLLRTQARAARAVLQSQGDVERTVAVHPTPSDLA